MSAIRFLTTVSRSVKHGLFSDPAVMQQVCKPFATMELTANGEHVQMVVAQRRTSLQIMFMTGSQSNGTVPYAEQPRQDAIASFAITLSTNGYH